MNILLQWHCLGTSCRAKQFSFEDVDQVFPRGPGSLVRVQLEEVFVSVSRKFGHNAASTSV
jgi:hypothetical protein